MSIECSTPEHTGVTVIAWIAVALYPIGIMAGSGILLFRVSAGGDSRRGESSPRHHMPTVVPRV